MAKKTKNEVYEVNTNITAVVDTAKMFVLNMNPLLKGKNIDEQVMQALLENYVMLVSPSLKAPQVLLKAADLERNLTEEYVASTEDLHYHQFVTNKVAEKIVHHVTNA